ncbi:hypothetical protein FPOAC2_14197 [Fusarium poae]|uniref:uncharacterized protein n=1 Tax=Fusarium poae TaxID=36050 RepID=UPI001D041E8F|nr:uncharacterized protein FPOAC1_013979 [Fusarium poae]KAG8664272.1 hypothetical protein FPOAC1_013979 [Fusarium poae]
MLVTLFGANGNLAIRITRILLQKPDISLKGYARDVSKIPEEIRNHPRYQAIQGQIDDQEKIHETVRGSDVVACLYQGFQDVVLDGQKLLIDICEEEKVGRFFSSAYVGDIRNMKVGLHERMDLPLQIFEYLKGKKNLPSVHIICGGFIETWLEYAGVIDLDTQTISYWGTGNEIWDLTSYDDTAAFTAEAIQDKSAVGYLKFRGDRISALSLAEVYERVTGNKPKLICRGTLDDLYKKMHEEKSVHQGKSPWIYLPLFYTYYTITGSNIVEEPLENSRYAHIKPQTVEDFMKTRDLSHPENLQAPISKSERVKARGN